MSLLLVVVVVVVVVFADVVEIQSMLLMLIDDVINHVSLMKNRHSSGLDPLVS